MIAQGVPKSKITVTGVPNFSLKNNKASTTDAEPVMTIESPLKTPRSKVKVLFASQPYIVDAFPNPQIRNEMISAVIDVFGIASNNFELTFKMHPVEKYRQYFFSNIVLKNFKLISGERSIDDLIGECDVFVTMFSQTTISAFLAGKPTINLSFHPDVGRFFLEPKTTNIAKSKKELQSLADSITRQGIHILNLENQKQSRETFLHHWIKLSQEKPESLILDFILKKLEN